MRFAFATLFATLATFVLTDSANADIIIAPADFSNFTFFGYNQGTGNSYVTAQATGGPTGGPSVIAGEGGPGADFGFDIYQGLSTTDNIEGASFTFTIDAKIDADSQAGVNQQILLAVEQNGIAYAYYLGRPPTDGTAGTETSTGYTTETYTVTLTAANFTELDQPLGANPNFTNGTATYFGFGFGNNSAAKYYIRDYANLGVDVTPAAVPTPEPSSIVTCVMALLSTVGYQLRRRFRNRRNAAISLA
jgi:hypothetical protein